MVLTPVFPEPSFLYKRDEGYCLNSQLHPWPPVAKPTEALGKDQLEAAVTRELDAAQERREARLLKAGYTDPQWRRIMLRHYGEDYEGMSARASMRAQELQSERHALDVKSSEIGLTSRSDVHLDRALPGNVAGIIEHCFGTCYFPAQMSPLQRRATWQLSPETAPISCTSGTQSPGKRGLRSRGHIQMYSKDTDRSQSAGLRADERGISPEQEDSWAWTHRESPASRLRKLDAEKAAMEENLGLWEREILRQKDAGDSAGCHHGAGIKDCSQNWKRMHTPQDSVIRLSDCVDSQSAGVPPEYAVASSQFPHRVSGEYGQPRQHALRTAWHSRGACGGRRKCESVSDSAGARVSIATLSKKSRERWWSKYDLT